MGVSFICTVSFISIPLSERGYVRLEKEALSLVFGIQKFHQFLYGRRLTVVMDHKPLLTILGPKTGLTKNTGRR